MPPTEIRGSVEGDLDFGGHRAFNPSAPTVGPDLIRLQDLAVGRGVLESPDLNTAPLRAVLMSPGAVPFGHATTGGLATNSELTWNTTNHSIDIYTANASSQQLRLGHSVLYYYGIGRDNAGSGPDDGHLRFYGTQAGVVGYIFGGVDGEWARISVAGNLGVGIPIAAARVHARSAIAAYNLPTAIVESSNVGGQAVLHFRVNGGLAAGVRGDYVGGLSLFANSTGTMDFYLGGDGVSNALHLSTAGATLSTLANVIGNRLVLATAAGLLAPVVMGTNLSFTGTTLNAAGGTSLTQGTGITFVSGTAVTSNLSTGIGTGQAAYGGLAAGNILSLYGSSHASNGPVKVPGVAAGLSFEVQAGTLQIDSSNVNTFATGLQALKFENTSGQTLVGFSFAGTMKSGIRCASDGSMNHHVTGGESFQFYASMDSSLPLASIGGTGVLIGGTAGAVETAARLHLVNANTAVGTPIGILESTNSSGQVPLHFRVNGGLVAGARADYAGGLSLFATGSGTMDFFLGGDATTNALHLSTAGATLSTLANVIGNRLVLATAAGLLVPVVMGTNLSFTGTTLNAAAGSSSPAGANTQIQYNNAGVFGASSGLTYDTTSGTVKITSSNVNTFATGLQTLKFENTSSQTLVGFSFAGTTKSGLRCAGDGSMNHHMSGGESFQFYGSMDQSVPLASIGGTGLLVGGGAGAVEAVARLHLVNANILFGTPIVILESNNAGGQVALHYKINGTVRGAIRADYPGDMWYSANGGSHNWYIGGDGVTNVAQLNSTVGMRSTYGFYAGAVGATGITPARQAFVADKVSTAASAASVDWNYVHIKPGTLTLTGSTSVTDTMGIACTRFEVPSITGSVSVASTVLIVGGPISGGGGDTGGGAISYPFALKVAAGQSYFADVVTVGASFTAGSHELFKVVGGTGGAYQGDRIVLQPGNGGYVLLDGSEHRLIEVTPAGTTVVGRRATPLGTKLIGTYFGGMVYTAYVDSGSAALADGSATVYIAGPPIQSGAGWTALGSASSLFVETGLSFFGGGLVVGSFGGNNALSAFPGPGPSLGFFGSQSGKLTVTGAKSGNAALASLCTALATYGLITNSTT